MLYVTNDEKHEIREFRLDFSINFAIAITKKFTEKSSDVIPLEIISPDFTCDPSDAWYKLNNRLNKTENIHESFFVDFSINIGDILKLTYVGLSNIMNESFSNRGDEYSKNYILDNKTFNMTSCPLYRYTYAIFRFGFLCSEDELNKRGLEIYKKKYSKKHGCLFISKLSLAEIIVLFLTKNIRYSNKNSYFYLESNDTTTKVQEAITKTFGRNFGKRHLIPLISSVLPKDDSYKNLTNIGYFHFRTLNPLMASLSDLEQCRKDAEEYLYVLNKAISLIEQNKGKSFRDIAIDIVMNEIMTNPAKFTTGDFAEAAKSVLNLDN